MNMIPQALIQNTTQNNPDLTTLFSLMEFRAKPNLKLLLFVFKPPPNTRKSLFLKPRGLTTAQVSDTVVPLSTS